MCCSLYLPALESYEGNLLVSKICHNRLLFFNGVAEQQHGHMIHDRIGYSKFQTGMIMINSQKVGNLIVVISCIAISFLACKANGMQRMAAGTMHARKASCQMFRTLRLRGGVEGPEPPVFEEREEVAEEDLARIQESVMKMWDVGVKETERLQREGGLDLKESRGKVSEISEQEAERILRHEEEERERAAKAAAAADEAEKQASPRTAEKRDESKAEGYTLGSQAPLSIADYMADSSQPPALPGTHAAGTDEEEGHASHTDGEESHAAQKEEVQDDINLNDLRKQLDEVRVFPCRLFRT
jgi:hypothetical protein